MLPTEPTVALATIAALLVGAATGVWAGPPRTGAARAGAGLVALLALGALGAALSAGVPGRAGLRLDVAAPLLLAYLAGCTVGAAVAARRGG